MSLKLPQSRKVILFIAAGLVAFILYLIYYVGTGNFIGVIERANLYYYSSAFAVFIVATFFSALTWHSLLKNLNIKNTIRKATLYTWAGYFFDATLPEPGWSGDVSKAYMLSKESDEDPGKVVATVVGQKIIGMLVTVFVLLVGFGIFVTNYALPEVVLVFVLAIMILSVGSLVVVYWISTSPKATRTMVGILTRVLSFVLRRRFNEAQFRADSEKFLSMFHTGIDTLNARKKSLLRPLLFYVLSVAFDVSVVFFTFASLGSPVPVEKVLIVYALTGTLQSVGVSVIGLTEIVMSTSYQILGIPLPLSFSATLLTRVITLWFKLVVGYVALQWAGVGILMGKKRMSRSATKVDV